MPYLSALRPVHTTLFTGSVHGPCSGCPKRQPWTRAGPCVWDLEVWPRQGAIGIHVYLYLYLTLRRNEASATITLVRYDLDLWPLDFENLFIARPLTWWLLVASFIEILPLSEEILHHAVNGQTMHGRPGASREYTYCWRRRSETLLKWKENSSFHHVIIVIAWWAVTREKHSLSTQRKASLTPGSRSLQRLAVHTLW